MHACTILNHHACTHPPHPLCMNLCHQASIYSSISLHMCTHPVHRACMHQSKSSCMYAPIYPVHPIMHVCMPAPVQTITGVHAPIHPIWHAYTLPSHHTCMHPSIRLHMHACIQAVLIWTPAVPNSEMSTMNAAPLYPAAFELTKISPPAKPGFKFSCSRPQTTLLLGNHKQTPFQRPLHCLHGKRRMKIIDPVSTSGQNAELFGGLQSH